jgi:hypothetical protein
MAMNDDRSLRGDPATPPSLRRDLDRFAQGTATAYDADRGLARLTASLALASAAGAPSWGARVKAFALKALSWPGLQVIAAIVMVGAAGTAVAVHASRERPAPIALVPHTSMSAPPATPRPDPGPSDPGPPVEPATSEPRRPEPLVAVSPAPASHASAKAPSAGASSHRGGAPPAPAHTDALHEEMLSVIRLREIAASAPEQAVGLAAESEARFGRDSIYAEERDAIAVTALARMGRADEARARARAFLDRHPNSPFAALVSGAVAP